VHLTKTKATADRQTTAVRNVDTAAYISSTLKFQGVKHMLWLSKRNVVNHRA